MWWGRRGERRGEKTSRREVGVSGAVDIGRWEGRWLWSLVHRFM